MPSIREMLYLPRHASNPDPLALHGFGFAPGHVDQPINPASVTHIGESAFANAEPLPRLDFPDGLTVVDRNAFAACRTLTDVPSLGKITSLAPHMFRACESLVRLVLPASLTSIGENACAGKSALKRVWIPAGVTSLAARAFDGCYRLAVVDGATGVTDVGVAAFDACYALTNAVVAGGNVGGAAVAAENRAGRVTLRLWLAKGDRVTGTNAMRSVSFRLDGATLVVPLVHIREIRMGAGEAADSVRLCSGDVLEGKTDLKQIDLQTVYASIVVNIQDIRVISVDCD